MRGEGGVAGEGRVVGLPTFHSWDKCTMPLMNINSDWMSNASSGLCIIFAGHLSCILGCNYMVVQHIRIVCIQTFATCLITEIGKQGIDYGENGQWPLIQAYALRKCPFFYNHATFSSSNLQRSVKGGHL